MSPLLTLEQAAAYLGRSPQWLANAARAGTVPSRKVGRVRRFTEDDLTAYLEAVREGNATGRIQRRRSA
jgi:excisionase family DNA binding protein